MSFDRKNKTDGGRGLSSPKNQTKVTSIKVRITMTAGKFLSRESRAIT